MADDKYGSKYTAVNFIAPEGPQIVAETLDALRAF